MLLDKVDVGVESDARVKLWFADAHHARCRDNTAASRPTIPGWATLAPLPMQRPKKQAWKSVWMKDKVKSDLGSDVNCERLTSIFALNVATLCPKTSKLSSVLPYKVRVYWPVDAL